MNRLANDDKTPQDDYNEEELFGSDSSNFDDYDDDFDEEGLEGAGNFWDLPRGEHSVWNTTNRSRVQEWRNRNKSTPPELREPSPAESMPSALRAQQLWEQRDPATGYRPVSQMDWEDRLHSQRTTKPVDRTTVPDSESNYFFQKRNDRVRMSNAHYLLSQMDHHPQQLCSSRGCMVRFIGPYSPAPGLRNETSRDQNFYPNIGLVFKTEIGQNPVEYFAPDELLEQHHKICGPQAPSKELCARSYKVVGSAPQTQQVTRTVPKGSKCPDCEGSGLETFSLLQGDGSVIKVPKTEKSTGTPSFEPRKVLVKGGTPAQYADCKDCKGSGLRRDPETKKNTKCTSCSGKGLDFDQLIKPAEPAVYKIKHVMTDPGKSPVYKKCSTCEGDGVTKQTMTTTEEIPGQREVITEPKEGECPFAYHMRHCDKYHDEGCTLVPQLARREGRPDVILHVLPFKYSAEHKVYMPLESFGTDRLRRVSSSQVEHLDPRDKTWQPNGENPFNYDFVEQMGTTSEAWRDLLKGLKQDWDAGVRTHRDPEKDKRVVRQWDPLNIPRTRDKRQEGTEEEYGGNELEGFEDETPTFGGSSV